MAKEINSFGNFVGPIFVDPDPVPDFFTWAFGPQAYQILNAQEFCTEWNIRHGHFFFLNKKIEIIERMPEMNQIWRNSFYIGPEFDE